MLVLLISFGSCFNIQELDTEMRTCKDQFKEFERQDVKYREDLKHLKQKIKKLDDKVEKARWTFNLVLWLAMTSFSSMFFLQDASKLDESMKDIDESSNLIPKLEGEIPKLQQLLLAEEKLLEEIKESSRGDSVAKITFLLLSY